MTLTSDWKKQDSDIYKQYYTIYLWIYGENMLNLNI